MVATAQRFNELKPGTEISWSKRSLQEFADKSIEDLASEFDLLVIDHPWAGYAAHTGALIPLDEYLSEEFLSKQAMHSVGVSFQSYTFNNHQWALAIDAATPVASSRKDLLLDKGLSLPTTFDELLSLAAKGLVVLPGIPLDTLMNFYMLCSAFGEDPFTKKTEVASKSVGTKALTALHTLGQLIDPECYQFNPIQVYEAMSSTDKYAYCPFAYGYSNYSRQGYSHKVLHFHDLVEFAGTGKLKTTLGGTGIAISAMCKNIDKAIDYLSFIASETCQQSLYFDNGGQPGHRKAWEDAHVNGNCRDFFKATLPALERAFLRPRYPNYMLFQDNAGHPIQHFMRYGGDPGIVLEEINALYVRSLNIN
ncbi:ABC transporter substrate-binding protein [Mucilaginibacter terrae]|uniref:ABC transporter substrate-binding protein n=1 Tax=Mucilaginibacter terrae TaxID=1955052 RepID=UPI0036319A03